MGILDFFKSVLSSKPEIPDDKVDELITLAAAETASNRYWYSIKASDIKVYREKIATLSDKEKVEFTLRQVNYITNQRSNGTSEDIRRKTHLSKAIVDQLFRSKLSLDDEEIERLAFAFATAPFYRHESLLNWPTKSLIGTIEKRYADKLPTPLIQKVLNNLKEKIKAVDHHHQQTQARKLIEQIDKLLFTAKGEEAERPVYFLGEDEFAIFANKLLLETEPTEKPLWHKLMAFSQKSGTSTTPSAKFLTEGKKLIDQIGQKKFTDMVMNWLNFITRLKEKIHPGRYVSTHSFITQVNVECLKGFVWLSIDYADDIMLQSLSSVAERSYRKIAGIGQTCTVLGNTAVFALAKSKGLGGVGHLSRLKMRAKQASTQTLIEKYLTAAAKEKGMSVSAIEDLAVNDFGLTEGNIQIELEGFQAEIRIEKIGKVAIKWRKPDGTSQTADPSIIKEKRPEELKNIKATIKGIESSLSTQRDRFDQRLRSTESISWAHFHENFFNHGLVSFISHKLIWNFTKPDDHFAAIFLNGKWVDTMGGVFNPDNSYSISLWHPALNAQGDVQRWRQFLIDKEILQPIKQAFREIYLLTDAELGTRTYSNRMAGHILKQHQFNSLAKARGWRYSLQGAFDNGSNGCAQFFLPEEQLVAQYWTDAVTGDTPLMNDSGIFRYVSTDQVRFKNTSTNATIDLFDIPVVILSEIMRDVDLFVGVASVGNDPAWRDSGDLPGYRDYWQSYSFGDLSEVAKGRKEILTRLLPRLKIARVATLGDKFLTVKGKKRTYKIHLGSTNILMEPNDQYLCIVPDRSPAPVTETVFLPFEGDNGLSVILSKAFLLADDDKITDVTITRQIG